MSINQSNEDDRLLSDKELGERTGMCRTLRWRLRRDGKLHAVRIGRSIGYPMSELRRILAEGTEGVRHG